MAKIKRLINFGLPVTACNMRCPYCYVSQAGWNTNELGQLEYPPEQIQRALTTKRLGGICHVSICGSGETLLPTYTVDLTKRILENGHYVSVVTNGTISNRINELCELPAEWRRRLFIKFSFHYLELQRKNLLETFIQNVHAAQKHGLAVTIELGAYDNYIAHIEEIHKICKQEFKADCHIVELREQKNEYARFTDLTEKDHQMAWQSFHSDLFDYQQTIWMEKRTEFCYAGDWILQLDARTGWCYPCFIGGEAIQNIFDNPDEPIRFCAIGNNCPWSHCYSAYVLLTSGAIPSLKTPSYAQMRDRKVAKNDCIWLTPSVSEFFSSKFIESNVEYSDNKKQYINALMALTYKNRRVSFEPEKTGQVLQDSFRRKGIRRIAIWGASIYTDWLLALLWETDILVEYIVDPEMSDPSERSPMKKLLRRWKKEQAPLLLTPTDAMKYVDAMVIVDYAHFNQIKGMVPLVYDRLFALTELVE